MHVFNKQKLSQFHGENGKPAYIAYAGKVYDVSESFIWKGGVHWVTHHAGQDLTEELRHAPHNDDMIKKFRVVGVFEEV
jgi:predicted heme/steroid binding protein